MSTVATSVTHKVTPEPGSFNTSFALQTNWHANNVVNYFSVFATNPSSSFRARMSPETELALRYFHYIHNTSAIPDCTKSQLGW